MSASRNLHSLAFSAVALALAGCAAPAPEAWRVEPNYRVSHTGTVAGMAQGYAALAKQYEGERRWSDALRAWQRAAAEAPTDVDVLDALGIALAGQGRYDEAVATLQRAVALAPQRARLQNNLGYALILAGREEEARNPLRAAVLLEPAHAMARANLQRVEPGGVPSTAVEAAAVAPATAEPVAATPVAAVVHESEAHAAPAVRIEPNVAELQKAEAVAALVSPQVDAPTEPAAAQPAPQPSPLQQLRVEIANGNGVTGMAAWLGGWLQQRGLGQRARLTNLRPYVTPATVVYYRSGFAAEAKQIAQRLPREAAVAEQAGGTATSDVRVVLGHDLRAHVACTPECRTRPGLSLAANDVTPR